MLLVVVIVAIIAALPALAEATDHHEIAHKVWIDAHVAERVAEASGGNLPTNLLDTIVDQDIDLLRGRRPNSTYEWAHFEKIEVGRVTQGATVNAGTKEHADRAEIRGRHVFRIIVEVPSRRRLVRRNPPVNISRIDFDYTDESGDKKFQSITPDALIAPGDHKSWNLPEIASDVVATVWARSTGEASNVELTLVHAQLFDDAKGPFFGALQSAKLLKTAIERKDAESTRTAAATLADRLETLGAGRLQPRPRSPRPGRRRARRPPISTSNYRRSRIF